MDFEMYDPVRIKFNGLTGVIIDISVQKDCIVYIVEADEKGKRSDASYPSEWSLYDCTKDEIERL